MARETTGKTIAVAATLAIVCSVLVSAAAVGLRERQQANKLIEKQKNVLMAAGLYDPKVPVTKAFETFEPKVVDLATGEYVPESEIDPRTYDQREASGDPDRSIAIDGSDDLARLGARAKYGMISPDSRAQFHTVVIGRSRFANSCVVEDTLVTIEPAVRCQHLNNRQNRPAHRIWPCPETVLAENQLGLPQ